MDELINDVCLHEQCHWIDAYLTEIYAKNTVITGIVWFSSTNVPDITMLAAYIHAI